MAQRRRATTRAPNLPALDDCERRVPPTRCGQGWVSRRGTSPLCRDARPNPARNMSRLLTGGYVATMDDAGTEHPDGWVLVDGGVITAVGSRAAGEPEPEADERIELDGA